jgi:hypothetical protein
MESTPLFCGRRGVRAEVSLDTYREAVVLCPNCGEGDTLTNARREAGLHEAHKLLSIMLRGVDRQATKGARGQGPPPSFRFVEGVDK